MESICWTCARAYARPDPEGCGFHRREHEHVFEAVKIEDRVNAAHEPMQVFLVTKCRSYRQETRKADHKTAAAKAWETRRERDRLEGIG